MPDHPISSTRTHARREPFRPGFAQVLIGAVALALVLTQPFTARSLPDPAPNRTFTYRGDTYVMDSFSLLFADTAIGNARRALFGAYLQTATEGKARVKRANTSDLEKVWATLHDEEQTTFLAVTAAAGALATSDGPTMLSFFTAVDEIHGSRRPAGGAEYENNEAFRLYVHLSEAGVARLKNDEETYQNTCTNKPIVYGGVGSRHPDFCQLPNKFEFDVKTDNRPNIQFNLTPGTRCADVDLDYRSIAHLTKDNSNVLAEIPLFGTPHVKGFIKQYCDPGFRR